MRDNMKLATLPYGAIYASIMMHFVRKIIARHINASAGCGIHVPESYDGWMLCLGFSSKADQDMDILVPIKQVERSGPYDMYNLAKLDDILRRHGYEPDMKKTLGCYLISSDCSRCKLFRNNALGTISNEKLAEMKRIAIANTELVKERSTRCETL